MMLRATGSNDHLVRYILQSRWRPGYPLPRVAISLSRRIRTTARALTTTSSTRLPVASSRPFPACCDSTFVREASARRSGSHRFLSSTTPWGNDSDDDDDDNQKKDHSDLDLKEILKKLEQQRQRSVEINTQLDQKTGRLWSDPWDLEDLMLTSKEDYDDLPDWSPTFVSRVSAERIQLYPGKLPTIAVLAHELTVAKPPPPHPGLGQTKSYALYRKRTLQKYVYDRVSVLVTDAKLDAIRALTSWEDKQDAVDDLFEEVESKLKQQEVILGKHPHVDKWVERALETYLKQLQTTQTLSSPASEDESTSSSADTKQQSTITTPRATSNDPASEPVPIFIDCYGPKDSPDNVVPTILNPLKVYERSSNSGKMVEEWEMAAHQETKRIMLRSCTQQIARIIDKAVNNNSSGDDPQPPSPARILVCGQQGVGKSVALTAMVAMARTSGYIVLYLPDGDHLHQNGFYVEPNAKRKGTYDLPVLSQQVCQQLLDSHQDDLKAFTVDKEILEQYFTADQLKSLLGDKQQADSSKSISDLLQIGSKKTNLAAMCYSAAVHVLMNQNVKPFLLVSDEFNCFHAPGHYYHADYDPNVRKAIPYDRISLFQPIMDAMAISTTDLDDYDENNQRYQPKQPICMKRGAVLVATSESHAVARKVTDDLINNLKQQQQLAALATSNQDASVPGPPSPPIHLVDVPRLSALEVEHMLAHYEAIGIGKLRMDRGETVMNPQEVAYLRMVSGAVPSKLLDACCMMD